MWKKTLNKLIAIKLAARVYNIHTYIYVYIHPFQKRCNLEINMKYIYLLFSRQKETLSDEKTKGVSITFFFSNCNVFKNGYIYIYTYICKYFKRKKGRNYVFPTSLFCESLHSSGV